MIEFIVLIGRKYCSNYVTESNNSNVQTKFLTVIFKNDYETIEHSKFVRTQK